MPLNTILSPRTALVSSSDQYCLFSVLFLLYICNCKAKWTYLATNPLYHDPTFAFHPAPKHQLAHFGQGNSSLREKTTGPGTGFRCDSGNVAIMSATSSTLAFSLSLLSSPSAVYIWRKVYVCHRTQPPAPSGHIHHLSLPPASKTLITP